MVFVLKKKEVDNLIRYLKYAEVYVETKKRETEMLRRIHGDPLPWEEDWWHYAGEVSSLKNLIWNQMSRNEEEES